MLFQQMLSVHRKQAAAQMLPFPWNHTMTADAPLQNLSDQPITSRWDPNLPCVSVLALSELSTSLRGLFKLLGREHSPPHLHIQSSGENSLRLIQARVFFLFARTRVQDTLELKAISRQRTSTPAKVGVKKQLIRSQSF